MCIATLFFLLLDTVTTYIGRLFVVWFCCDLCFNLEHCSFSNSSSVGSALPRRRCCAYITIGMICIFIGVGLTVSEVLVLYLKLCAGLHMYKGIPFLDPAFD